MESAKTMFEKLGYLRKIQTSIYEEEDVKYIKDNNKTKTKRIIEFSNNGKYIDITEQYNEYLPEDNINYNYIDLEELQAINKQIEELGWLKDE